MKGSGIGGQAVMEGVMMKNKDKYAVAVRKPDNEIIVDVKEHKALGSSIGLDKIPILRGIVAFIDSLELGVGTLTYSASFFEDEDEKKPQDEASLKKKEKQEKAMMAGTVVLSVVLAVGIFMLLPYFISQLLRNVIESAALLALVEGILRVALFVGYVAAISFMEDIKRVFMYHGAEHKSINCIENGLELTVENVRKQSRQHKRCGTSFLLIVMLISVLFFMFIRVDNAWLRVLARLILIPIIAGISYEFIRVAGRSNSKCIMILSKPGMALQNLTTREPDDSMIECAIASVEAVFDWKDFLAHYNDTEEKKSSKNWEPFSDEEDDISGNTENKKPAESATTPGVKGGKSKKSSEIDSQKQNETGAQKKSSEETKKPSVQDNQKKSKEQKKAEEQKKSEEQKKAEEQKKSEEQNNPEQTAQSSAKDFRTPTPDNDEDDEILKALDQYFVLKQKKD